jgi:hypothetical protein
MLKICTVYFEGFYTPDYVSKLYRALKRNSNIPFEFICISDNKNIEADVILPYNHYSDIKKHWHKLKFFSPQFGNQKPGDDIIIMDIDQIIVSNIDELLNWPVSENELLTYGQWWTDKLKINGGFYKFKSGSLKCIWDDFVKNVEFWQLNYYRKGIVHTKYYGEQNYVNWKVQEHKIKLTLTPQQWLCKYTDNFKQNLELNKTYSQKFNTDYMILDDVHKYIKVVHFTGVGKTIHNCDAKFIKENWNVI